jgi:hypothetical protein
MKKIDLHMILLFYKKNKVLIRLWGNDHNRIFFGMGQPKERIFRKINYINNSKVL